MAQVNSMIFLARAAATEARFIYISSAFNKSQRDFEIKSVGWSLNVFISMLATVITRGQLSLSGASQRSLNNAEISINQIKITKDQLNISEIMVIDLLCELILFFLSFSLSLSLTFRNIPEFDLGPRLMTH